MKALTNLRNTIPTFFANFIDKGFNELIQVVEFQEHFVVLAYDKFDETYTVSKVEKDWAFDESNAFVDNDTFEESDYQAYVSDANSEYFTSLNSFEDYANMRFFTYLGTNTI